MLVAGYFPLSIYYPLQLFSMKKKAQIKKEEVRQIILETLASSNLVEKMELVDTLQRIGVDYHYKKEINDLLCYVYNDKDGGSSNLYITSLRFYLLRSLFRYIRSSTTSSICFLSSIFGDGKVCWLK